MGKSKVISAREAANLIKDGDTLGIQGVVTGSVPVDLMEALSDRYVETQTPKGITPVHISGIGDGKEGGMNMFAHEGLIGKLICGHVGLAPKLHPFIKENKFPAFVVPQGVLAQLLRAIGGKRPGLITTVGLKTFADPRVEGCRVNQAAWDLSDEEQVVELLKIRDKDYLLYKSFPINVCFIRATTADVDGNLSIEKEAIKISSLEFALATKNSGGIVIAQVERLTEAHTIKPHDVVVPGVLVDYIVIGSEHGHRQYFPIPEYHPEWSGETRLPMVQTKPTELSDRKICGRRAALELKEGDLVNLGIGMPEAVVAVAEEEGIASKITLTIEAGSFGGVPQSGLAITASTNVEAVISHADMFVLYDGGSLDIAVLGMAEVDKQGNVNVSKFGGKIVGPGGFVNISQNTQKIVFVGSFVAGKVKKEFKDGKINIIEDGKVSKFVDKVEQITFSGEYANETGRDILYVTERAVFKLVPAGLELIEIAPGIDLQKDVLEKMAFKPIISEQLKEMDPRIFADAVMNLEI